MGIENITTKSMALVTSLYLATQPVLSQPPMLLNSVLPYGYEVKIMRDITKSEVSNNSINYKVKKIEKQEALSFFAEQRPFTEKEYNEYNNMLKRLSVETGVNILELL